MSVACQAFSRPERARALTVSEDKQRSRGPRTSFQHPITTLHARNPVIR